MWTMAKEKGKKKKKVNLSNNFEAYNVMNGITCWVIIFIHILVILDVVARHIKTHQIYYKEKAPMYNISITRQKLQ